MVHILQFNTFEGKTFAIQNLLVTLHRVTIMHVISHRKLKEFYESPGKEDSRIALERWYDIAQQAEWHNLSEIKEDFPATDYVGNQHMYLISKVIITVLW